MLGTGQKVMDSRFSLFVSLETWFYGFVLFFFFLCVCVREKKNRRNGTRHRVKTILKYKHKTQSILPHERDSQLYMEPYGLKSMMLLPHSSLKSNCCHAMSCPVKTFQQNQQVQLLNLIRTLIELRVGDVNLFLYSIYIYILNFFYLFFFT